MGDLSCTPCKLTSPFVYFSISVSVRTADFIIKAANFFHMEKYIYTCTTYIIISIVNTHTHPSIFAWRSCSVTNFWFVFLFLIDFGGFLLVLQNSWGSVGVSWGLRVMCAAGRSDTAWGTYEAFPFHPPRLEIKCCVAESLSLVHVNIIVIIIKSRIVNIVPAKAMAFQN